MPAARSRRSSGPRLADANLARRIETKAAYERRLKALQVELLSIQQAYLTQARRAVIVFEGWDAAGKGGVIRRLAEPLDPRSIKVWPIAAPRADEHERHYLYRFWMRLPERGEIAVFDRSWYGRVLVERVEKIAAPPAWRRAYREINEFERLLLDDGVRLVKLFLHVSAAEQLKRFRERIEVPHKRWKIGAADLRNRSLRPAYAKAIDEMFAKTSMACAPWHLIPADSKWFARIACLKIIARELGAGVDLEPPPVPKALRQAIERAEKGKG